MKPTESFAGRAIRAREQERDGVAPPVDMSVFTIFILAWHHCPVLLLIAWQAAKNWW